MQERLRIAQATAERLGTIIDNAKRTFGIQGSITNFIRNLQQENATASQTLEVVRQLLRGTQREATECSELRRRVQAYQQGADEATNRISAAEDDQVQAEREHAEHVERLQTESARYQDAILKLVDDTKTREAAWQAQEIEYRDAASKSETEGLAQSQHCTLVERQNDTLTAELKDYKANCDKQQEENKCLALELKACEEVRSQLTDDKITLELRLESEHQKSTQLGLALDEQKAIVSDLLAKQVSLSSALAHLKVLLKAENQSPHLSQLSWKI